MKKLLRTAFALLLCAAVMIAAGPPLASAAEITDPPAPAETVEPAGPKTPDRGGETPAAPNGGELPDGKGGTA